MATKSKLRIAVEKQADELEDAQKELVLSQFSTYEWNKERMRQIETQLALMDKQAPDDPKEMKLHLARRKALTAERNQLTTANNSISSKMFMNLRGTGAEADEFDDFFSKEGGDER